MAEKDFRLFDRVSTKSQQNMTAEVCGIRGLDEFHNFGLNNPQTKENTKTQIRGPIPEFKMFRPNNSFSINELVKSGKALPIKPEEKKIEEIVAAAKKMAAQNFDSFSFYLFFLVKMAKSFPIYINSPFRKSEILDTEYFLSDETLKAPRHFNAFYLIPFSKPLKYAPTTLATFLFLRVKIEKLPKDFQKMNKQKLDLSKEIENKKKSLGKDIKILKTHTNIFSKTLKTHTDYFISESRWTGNVFNRERKDKDKIIQKLISAIENHNTKKEIQIEKERQKINRLFCKEFKSIIKNCTKIAVQKNDLLAKRLEKSEIIQDLHTLFGSAEEVSKTIHDYLQTVNEKLWDPSECSLFHGKEMLPNKGLREYQLIGINWLLGLFKNNTNGILADEMGLGKTVQTIALFARLATEHNLWGPHLIIVPASVVLNWDLEFKRWLPAFKVVTYHGDFVVRKKKRAGWGNLTMVNVVITSYSTAVTDIALLKRRKWLSLVLDEAHNVKNASSKRWNSLLLLKAHRRIFLTGTPLQNNVMELWSLLHFLMPGLFRSAEGFREWFFKPLKSTQIFPGKEEQHSGLERSAILRLKTLIEPFILRRLKKTVNLNLPNKTEKIIVCSLSKRQRQLYEDFLNRGKTKRDLKSKKFLSVLNVFAKLRKVCNHPDLFEGKETKTSMNFLLKSDLNSHCLTEEKYKIEETNYTKKYSEKWSRQKSLNTRNKIQVEPSPKRVKILEKRYLRCRNVYSYGNYYNKTRFFTEPNKEKFRRNLFERNARITAAHASLHAPQMKMFHAAYKYLRLTPKRNKKLPISTFFTKKKYEEFIFKIPEVKRYISFYDTIEAMTAKRGFEGFYSPLSIKMLKAINPYFFSPSSESLISLYNTGPILVKEKCRNSYINSNEKYNNRTKMFDRRSFSIADPESLLSDSGKLSVLYKLIGKLKYSPEKHRCVIFSQMAKTLDLIELFLADKKIAYLRLDGSTPLETRQSRVERFNMDPNYFCFLSSTRSGGIGINLTGADTVIFYDSDWNPAIDLQAQDRCHRLGQNKEVTVYRLITENTIEANIHAVSEKKKAINAAVLDQSTFIISDEKVEVKLDENLKFVTNLLKDIGKEECKDTNTSDVEKNTNKRIKIDPQDNRKLFNYMTEQIDEKLKSIEKLEEKLSFVEKVMLRKIQNNFSFYEEESKNRLAPGYKPLKRFPGASASKCIPELLQKIVYKEKEAEDILGFSDFEIYKNFRINFEFKHENDFAMRIKFYKKKRLGYLLGKVLKRLLQKIQFYYLLQKNPSFYLGRRFYVKRNYFLPKRKMLTLDKQLDPTISALTKNKEFIQQFKHYKKNKPVPEVSKSRVISDGSSKKLSSVKHSPIKVFQPVGKETLGNFDWEEDYNFAQKSSSSHMTTGLEPRRPSVNSWTQKSTEINNSSAQKKNLALLNQYMKSQNRHLIENRNETIDDLKSFLSIPEKPPVKKPKETKKMENKKKKLNLSFPGIVPHTEKIQIKESVEHILDRKTTFLKTNDFDKTKLKGLATGSGRTEKKDFVFWKSDQNWLNRILKDSKQVNASNSQYYVVKILSFTSKIDTLKKIGAYIKKTSETVVVNHQLQNNRLLTLAKKILENRQQKKYAQAQRFSQIKGLSKSPYNLLQKFPSGVIPREKFPQNKQMPTESKQEIQKRAFVPIRSFQRGRGRMKKFGLPPGFKANTYSEHTEQKEESIKKTQLERMIDVVKNREDINEEQKANIIKQIIEMRSSLNT